LVYTLATGEADTVRPANGGKCRELERWATSGDQEFDPLRECPMMRRAFQGETGIRLPRTRG